MAVSCLCPNVDVQGEIKQLVAVQLNVVRVADAEPLALPPTETE
jgi:hypothetical protein